MQKDTKATKIGNVVNDNKPSLPSWFYQDCSRENIFENHPEALSNLLNGCRQDVYSALSLYQIHVKYATTLIISLLTVVGVVFSILRVTGVNLAMTRTVEIGAVMLMMVAFFIGLVSLLVIARYYNVYISALLYGAQIHFAAGMSGFYWFERIIETLQKEHIKKQKKKQEINKKKFIFIRTWSWKDSHLWYAAFLAILSFICLIVGIVMWTLAPFSSSL